MAMRIVCLVLALANLVFFAGLRGYVELWGTGNREPERALKQIEPQAIVLIPPARVAQLEQTGRAQAQTVPSCMEFGGVGPDASDEELRRIAPDHPAFRINP